MRLRLLFDCHTFDMEPQGTSTFLAGLLNALPQVSARTLPNVQLELHGASANESALRDWVSADLMHHPIRTGFMTRNAWELPRLAVRLDADVVVSQYVRPLWVPKRSASVIHDLLFLDYPSQFSISYRWTRSVLFGWSARFSSHVFTVSDYSRHRIADVYRMAASCVGVLPNAAPAAGHPPERPPQPAPQDRVRLLYVSRLEPRKRHEWCVRLLEVLIEAGVNAELTLVGGGGGPYAEQLRANLKGLSAAMPGRLHHLEHLSAQQLQAQYAAADLFLFPSLGEGFGIPVIEAAVNGLPCVVTDGSALTELRPYYVGESFQGHDFQSFLAATRKVVTNLGQYGRVARERASQTAQAFTWDETARRFLAAIAAGA